MICASNPCGCAIKSSSLRITGGGNQGSPWVIETNAFQVCTSTTRPPTPRVGDSIFETDMERYRTWDGTYWIIMGGAFPHVNCTHLSTDTAIPVADATPSNWVLANEISDVDGFHVGTTGVYTVPFGLGGDYAVSSWAQWTPNPVGYRLAMIRIGANGSTPAEQILLDNELIPSINTSNTYQTAGSDDIRLEAGATVTFQGYQTSGGPLTIVRAKATLRMKRHIPSLT